MCTAYYNELKIFKNVSEQLIQKGGAYFVIIANHELYRFLYPYEPYEDFVNNDPVNFITEKISSLNQFLKTCMDTVAFYDFKLQSFEETGKVMSADISLERNTSNLYTSLWKQFEKDALLVESKKLLEKRISEETIKNHIEGKVVLDMGCGSGRYSVALSLLGAKKVYGIDLFEQSYNKSEQYAKENKLNIEFSEANFHNLPFADETFDFVFSNGVIHHSTSIQKSLEEFNRVLKMDHYGFLYIYADKGIFWNTRKVMREIFENIPAEYTNAVLKVMGMPSNRFIFSDVWHVPIEEYTTREQIESMLEYLGFSYEKIISNNKFDLDAPIENKIQDAEAMWGDGEHRYLIHKSIK